MKRAWSAIADNWAAGTAATISLFLVGLWVRYSEETYRRLYAALEAKGILAALFLALLGIIWLAVNLIYEKKKHSLDGIPKGFTLNNESVGAGFTAGIILRPITHHHPPAARHDAEPPVLFE